MADESPDPPALVVPLGTRVVTCREVRADSERAHRPVGSVAEIVGLPADALHRYLIRSPTARRPGCGARSSGCWAGTARPRPVSATRCPSRICVPTSSIVA